MSVNRRIIAAVREQKVGLFAERDNAQEAFEYAQSLFQKKDHAALTTALMVYHNTLLETLSKLLEDPYE